jgi:hypothetical protein
MAAESFDVAGLARAEEFGTPVAGQKQCASQAGALA